VSKDGRTLGVRVVSGVWSGVWSDRYATVHEAGWRNQQPEWVARAIAPAKCVVQLVRWTFPLTQERRLKLAQSSSVTVGLFASKFQLRAWNQLRGYVHAGLESTAKRPQPTILVPLYPQEAQALTRKKSMFAKHHLTCQRYCNTDTFDEIFPTIFCVVSGVMSTILCYSRHCAPFNLYH
jgi:hypothetical protein